MRILFADWPSLDINYLAVMMPDDARGYWSLISDDIFNPDLVRFAEPVDARQSQDAISLIIFGYFPIKTATNAME